MHVQRNDLEERAPPFPSVQRKETGERVRERNWRNERNKLACQGRTYGTSYTVI